ncbi:S-adenosyl-L-methionine-dependent methyltransferase [Cantharellus anzutake]|uniref:S-adenosyl-L-methionine-dependent methyltransferase n=1 Tax=Cantharellus anzutake TaxID=1750568 RepID=UPI001904A095|nr:S-adenosyl-L-methionine-dependent methyltransferase [Cantharellus anzutake]KAF8343991.1 S-adenosyl-L-methionine-dependent methyltransferase [Cantharellus anzutake]
MPTADLDLYRRIRLINYIRRNKVKPSDLDNLHGNEDFFSEASYLQPVIENDPLLQLDTGDWSDDDSQKLDPRRSANSNTGGSVDISTESQVEALGTQLREEQSKTAYLQSLVQELVGSKGDIRPGSSMKPSALELVEGRPIRDDDSHYFDSYSYQEIHATMLQDHVRTSSYAKFILSNPQLFHDKLVMDVGCGTGILSLFVARAGAKHVFAVDASSIAVKARQIVKDNDLEDVITVIQGKVEDILLPPPYSDPSVKIDVIVSEWMGYALLYESMLDSVLVARDRFLCKPSEDDPIGGVMAPSQCQMIMALGDSSDIVKDRITFWEDVYGFKMTSMAEEAYADALIEDVKPDAIMSDLVVIKDLHLQRIVPRELDFTSSFKLTATKDGVVRSFILYFDSWFMPDGSDVPPDAEVTLVEPSGTLVPTAEYLQVGPSKARSTSDATKPLPLRRRSTSAKKMPTVVSFSTGPNSFPTHWKQTIFLLKSPFKVIEGSIVSGSFHCRKSDSNSRALDVEIHYAVSHTGLGVTSPKLVSSPFLTVQTFNVR